MLHSLVIIVLFGLFDWAVQTLVPMTDKFKQIVHVLTVVGAIVLILQETGLLQGHLAL